jgi:NAD-dependent SIR2 family protein deacetylase
MNNGYSQRIEKAKNAITNADFVIVGGGAGLSDAAGLKYSGKRFTDNFQPFIYKYHFTDLYTSSFYPFKTEEERWAYWAKHISLNRYETPATQLYNDIFKLVKPKNYFVITTNVESQFYKAGFLPEKTFAVQGDYGFFQCSNACHNKLYYNEELITEMLTHTIDCIIPSSLVPYCPVCGVPMDVNLRKDNSFVEDENWDKANERYNDFVKSTVNKKLVLIELGVGFNTPGIIRYPFEQITFQNKQATLIQINAQHAFGVDENSAKTILFSEDMSSTINDLQ